MVDPEIDFASMSTQAGRFHAMSGTLNQDLATYQRNANALGEPWGADTAGRNFASGYVPFTTSLLALLPDLSADLSTIGDELNTTSNWLGDTDVANADGIGQVGDDLAASPVPPTSGLPAPVVD
jgi:hypothetical protein